LQTHRLYEVTTLGVSVWHILEYEHTELPESSVGQFHRGDSYVVRWLYTITVTGERWQVRLVYDMLDMRFSQRSL
jgi:supervillin